MADSEDDLAGVPLLEDSDDSIHKESKTNNKRKRGLEDSASTIKPKKKQTKKPKDIDDDALDAEAGLNHAIAHMDPSLMADHFAQRTRRFQPDLSVVEADDTNISSKWILDTTTFTEARDTAKLAQFLETFISTRAKDRTAKLSSAPSAKGAPHTIVIAASGLRAADLTRALRGFQTSQSMVAKLFAKHIKLKEALETTKTTRMGIGVGTPQRLIDLIDNEALKLDYVERIVVDASHIDTKKRGILDMKEIQVPLAKLLTRSDLKDRYTAEKHRVKLLFF